jgi:twitching motility two-component system response regulator PilH
VKYFILFKRNGNGVKNVSTFSLWLPYAHSSLLYIEGNKLEEAMASIIHIDDSSADTSMMKSILASAGHQVTSYNDPTAIEEKVAAAKPALVLLDIVMPQRNGYEVLRAIKRNLDTKDIPVVLVSSKSEETDVRWGLRQGASDYITKPYNAQMVLSKVKPFLG